MLSGIKRSAIEIPAKRREKNVMSEHKPGRRKNFIESYCVKIANIPIHLINQIKDQESELAPSHERGCDAKWRRKRKESFSYLFLIRMDYTPRKLQSKLMRILTQMYRLVFVFPFFLGSFAPSPHKGTSRDYLKVCERKIFGSMSTGAVGRLGKREQGISTHTGTGLDERK
jgi:hypothetical protein